MLDEAQPTPMLGIDETRCGKTQVATASASLARYSSLS
jgi:hypothetical protein